MYIRRFLCTEEELAQEGSSAAYLLGDANTRDYFSKNPNKRRISMGVRSECFQELVFSKATCCKPSVAAALSRQQGADP